MLLMGARHYWPRLGRFMQPDPAALEDNLYGYGGNSPTTNVDPAGTCYFRFYPVPGGRSLHMLGRIVLVGCASGFKPGRTLGGGTKTIPTPNVTFSMQGGTFHGYRHVRHLVSSGQLQMGIKGDLARRLSFPVGQWRFFTVRINGHWIQYNVFRISAHRYNVGSSYPYGARGR